MNYQARYGKNKPVNEQVNPEPEKILDPNKASMLEKALKRKASIEAQIKEANTDASKGKLAEKLETINATIKDLKA